MAGEKRSSFISSQIRYADTHSTGGITVRGFELQTDEDGHIQAPPDLAKEIEPHGFLAEGTPGYAAWLERRKAGAQDQAQKRK